MVKSHLDSLNVSYAEVTIKQYLFNLMKEEQIFNSGRGWYSSIQDTFNLDTEPVNDIIEELKKQFPLLPFSCWSTEQIKYYYHHLQTKFVTFVYSQYDTLPVVYEYLRSVHSNTYLNPNKKEIRKNYTLDEGTIVLRSSITEEPVQNHFATIEKILVDLFLEKDKVHLVDGAEYDRIFSNVISSSRINISRFLRYAKRREVRGPLSQKIY